CRRSDRQTCRTCRRRTSGGWALAGRPVVVSAGGCCAALGIDTQRPCARLDGAASCSSPMKPRISLLTLGVDDLERSLAFYRDGLGLPTEGIIGTEFERGAVAFFELSGGLKLALWE